MKYYFVYFLILIFHFSNCFSQIEKPFSLYLIGDSGEDTASGKALLMLQAELDANPNSAVVFLGDNVYPSGLKQGDKVSEKKLLSQLRILNEYKGQAYFIPGNHDWASQGTKGLKRINNEENYVEQYVSQHTEATNKGNAFLPSNALPGPETVLLSAGIRLICIDTQWFLHQYKKNKIQSKRKTIELFYHRLDSIINCSKQNNEQLIIAAHHPIYSNGLHAKSKQPIRFLINYTPFRIFGFMGLTRLFTQDLPQPSYSKMRKRLLQSINRNTNIIYASGHDHNFQLFKMENNNFIVSGAGSKFEPFCKKNKFDSSYQCSGNTGFVKIDFYTSDKKQFFLFQVGKEKIEVE
jgi:hypothetical protein